jgi:GntR family transcriptional regulator/MocR family aminotransferase
MDQHSSAIDQATLARFLIEGFFLSHIKRMRKIYSERREFFIEKFNDLLGDYFNLQITETGLHFVAWVRDDADVALIRRVANELGIGAPTLSFFCIQARLKPALLFGFAAWTRAQIREGLMKFAVTLKKEKALLQNGAVPKKGARRI